MTDTNIDELVKVSVALAEIERLAADGQYGDAARKAIDLGLDLLPVDELRAYLTNQAQQRADAIADAAEAAKLGED